MPYQIRYILESIFIFTCELIYEIFDLFYVSYLLYISPSEIVHRVWREWFYFMSPHYLLSGARPAFVIAAGVLGVDFLFKHYKLYDTSTWDAWFTQWLPTWLYKPKSYRSAEHERILLGWQRFQAQRDNLEFGKRDDKIAAIKQLRQQLLDYKNISPQEITEEFRDVERKINDGYIIAAFDHHPVFLLGGLFCGWFRVNNGLKLLYGPQWGLQLADYVTGHLHALGRWLLRTVQAPRTFERWNPNSDWISLTNLAETAPFEDGKHSGICNAIIGSDGQREWRALSDHEDIPTSKVLTPDFSSWRIKRRRRLQRVPYSSAPRTRFNPKRKMLYRRTRLNTWPEMDPVLEGDLELLENFHRKKISPVDYIAGANPALWRSAYYLNSKPTPFQWDLYYYGRKERRKRRRAKIVKPGQYSDCNSWIWDSKLQVPTPDPWGYYKPEPASPGVYAANRLRWALGVGLNVYFYYNELLYPIFLEYFC